MSREDLHAALDALAKAHGSSELVSAMRTVQRTVRENRKDSSRKIGPFAKAVMEALTYRDQLKAKGATGRDLDAGLEGVLRDTWPRGGPENASHAKCPDCDGCGLLVHECPGDATCGRPTRHGPHTYGDPCFCEKGRRFKEKPRPEPSEFTDAGKHKKSGPTRFGR